MTGEGIKKISKEGFNQKKILGIKLREGTFWHGNFAKAFPKTIKEEDYLYLKHMGVKDTLNKLSEDVVKKKLIPAQKVAREIGVTAETMVKMIKRGDTEGKLFGNRWYVTKRGYDKIITP